VTASPHPGRSTVDGRRLDTGGPQATLDDAGTLALFETLLAKAPVGFGFVDRHLKVVRVNDTLAAMSGSAANELGRPIAEMVPGDWPRLEPVFRGLLDGGDAILDVELDLPVAAAAGLVRHWLMSCYPVAVDGQVIGIGIVVVDTTGRKQDDEARRTLSAIVDGSGDAIFGLTTEGMVTSWNPAAERLYGYRPDEIIGQPVALLAPTADVERQNQMKDRLNAGGPAEQAEVTRLRKDGTPVDVLITASTAPDADGAVVGLSVIAHDITERRATQQDLEASQRRLAEAQRVAHVGSFELDLHTGEMSWSDEHFRILGLDPGEQPTSELFISMVHPADLPGLDLAWKAAIEQGIPVDRTYRIIRRDAQERFVRARLAPEVGADGAVSRLIGTLMDDTERIAADRLHRDTDTRFEIGFEQTAIGTAITDLDGLPTRVNPALCRLLARAGDDLIGRQWPDCTYPGEVPLTEAASASMAQGRDVYEDERRFVRPDGSIVWASCLVTLVRDESAEPQYLYAQLQDVTQRKHMEQELIHQAFHDSLTGLSNRALLTDRLAHGLTGAHRQGARLGLVFIDLDHFKDVNDSLGHSSGDQLLRQAAERIAEVIRPKDTVARFGGDEFVVLCDDVSMREAQQVGERLLDTVRRPFVIGEDEVNVTASLGIAVADEHATPESLLRDADTAMHRAKERGRDRLELFDEALRSRAARRLATTTALHHGLERDEFVVHYQPIVDLSTGTLVSAEALLRWEHPDRGLVSPDDFIPLAERTGIIVPIGAWVLEQACARLAEWQRTEPSMSVSVNVSARQIVPGFVALVGGVLTRTGTAATDLCLEMTESVLMDDVDYYGKTLADLKDLGVRLSIDDFGTGYSSLSYMKRFPVDAVKVDRSFVDGLGTDAHSSALVAAIIAIAVALDLEVTAEGIETPEQLCHLRRLHCQRAQGYHLARPMPAAAMDELVTQRRRWSLD
jgi:diguanylate cyclase (GGDEF)-like protein/PAS domain S-box-containing protein